MIFVRFLRGFIAGAVGAGAVLTPVALQDFHSLATWLSLLLIAVIQGGITGGILALDKYLRTIPTDQDTLIEP
ncbi:MAG TPA: hypothetical protein VJ464_13340 [Blastocatellia bacterium]|nr:hypothetical protein [Blastocatellia bacterium]